MNAWLRGAAMAVFFLTLSCSRCKSSTGDGSNKTDIVTLLPKGAVGVVVAPSIEALGAKMTALQRLKIASFASQLQGFGSAQAFGDALVQQIGFDLRSPTTLAEAGIDSKRALGLFASVNAHVYVLVPVADEAKFLATLQRIASGRLGASVASTVTIDHVTINTLSTAPKLPPRVGCVLRNGYALLATDDGTGALAGFGAMTPEKTLSTDEQLQARLKADLFEKQLWGYFPSGSPALAKASMRDAYFSAQLSDTGLTIRTAGQWQGDPKLLEALQNPAKPVSASVPQDAFFVAQTLSNPQQLLTLAKLLLGPRLEQLLAEAHLDLDREVLSQLAPGTVAALSMAEKPPIGQGLPQFDLRKTNPFRYVQLSGTAPLVVEPDIEPALKKLVEAAPGFGAKISTAKVQEQTVYLTTYAQGEGVHLATAKRSLYFASPQPRLEALLAQTNQREFKGNASALSLRLNLSSLTSAVRALPADAWGLGGVAIKATTVRWLDATDDLTAVQADLNATERDLSTVLTLSLSVSSNPQSPGQ